MRLGPASALGISYGPTCRGCFAGATTGVDLRSAALVAECGGVAALVRAVQTHGNDTEAELDAVNVAEQARPSLRRVRLATLMSRSSLSGVRSSLIGVRSSLSGVRSSLIGIADVLGRLAIGCDQEGEGRGQEGEGRGHRSGIGHH